ncbi:hypothetical protein ACEPPN_004278 [Leptodophora sp. 'Broadleaf-Isolate-01']
MRDVSYLTPVVCYGIVVLALPASLYLPQGRRTPLLLLVWGLLGYCIWTCHYLDQIVGLQIGFQVGMSAFITALHAPIVTGNAPCTAQVNPDGSVRWSFWTAFKIANNPRALPSAKNTSSTKRSRFLFSIGCLLKLAVILGLRHVAKMLAMAALSQVSPWDFLPSRQSLVRRLIAGSISRRELGLRTFISMNWIMTTITELEISHTLTKLLFVSVFRVDEPYEWPSLFGDPRDAYTLRRFWGRFWHQLLSPAAGKWGHAFAKQVLRMQAPSLLKKAFVALFIFSASGTAHMFLAWRSGQPDPSRAIWFYWINFAAVCFEIVVSKVLGERASSSSLRRSGIGPIVKETAKRILGFVWVFVFFLWVIPRLEYPTIFHAILSNSLPAKLK